MNSMLVRTFCIAAFAAFSPVGCQQDETDATPPNDTSAQQATSDSGSIADVIDDGSDDSTTADAALPAPDTAQGLDIGDTVDTADTADTVHTPDTPDAADIPDTADTPDTADSPDTPDTVDTDSGPPPAKACGTTSTVAPAFALPGVQYNGSVGYSRNVKVGGNDVVEYVEISAPILPQVLVMYAFEGQSYPTTTAGLVSAVDKIAITYDFLLSTCPAKYPGITLLAAGATKPLDAATLQKNFELVAKCSYDLFKGKSYWIPAFVDDVDICCQVLGPSWRLLHETDTAAITKDQAKLLKDALTAPGSWASPYFSLVAYVRTTSGALMLSTLTENAKVEPVMSKGKVITAGSEEWRVHVENVNSLRCLRSRAVGN